MREADASAIGEWPLSGCRPSLSLLLICSFVVIFAARADAQTVLPQGGTVASGQVRIGAPAGNALTINQSSSKGVVDWNSFSVGRNASVNFVQPNSGAAILNRVTGTTSSTIAGQITANGQVFLVNPNGIAITPSGSVQVGGGFVASTLDISNADFNAGKLSFVGKGASAAVSNAGQIIGASGAFVGLIGGTVSNGGTISVPLGKVGLGAGEKVVLNPSGDGFLQVALPTGATTSDGKALIDVAGRIKTAGGIVQIKTATTQQAVHDIVNVSGSISARSVRGRPGNIVLDGGGGSVTVSGKLVANGSKHANGGTVVVTGDQVALTSTAKISASGASGGSVLIGGDMRGGTVPSAKLVTAPVATARTTLIAQGASISAKGNAGDGGKVVVWSDEMTDFRGSITTIGAGAGNGGAVEVSSHGVLGYAGSVDVTASNGKTGTLLLDPFNVTISSGSDTNISNSSNTFSPSGNGSILSVTTLQNALAAANVTVDTGSSGAQAGNITVANVVNWSSGNSLVLTAAGAVNVNAAITATNGSLSLTGSTISVSGTSISLGGTLTGTATASGAATAVSFSNATISVGSGTSTISGTSSSGFGANFSGISSFTATGSGTLALSGTSTSGTGANLAIGASLSSSGTVSIAGTSTNAAGLNAGGTNTITAGAGSLAVAGTSTSGIGLLFNGGSNSLTKSGAGTLAISGTTSSNIGLELNTNANLTTAGSVTLNGTSNSLVGLLFNGGNTLTASSGALTLDGTSTNDAGLQMRGTVALTNAGATTFAFNGNTSSYRGVELFGGGSTNVTVSGNASIFGTSNTGTGVIFGTSSTFGVSSGNVTVNGTSTATIGNGATLGTRFASASVTNFGSGSLTITGTSDDAVASVNSGSAGVLLTGTNSLTNAGAGTLSLTGVNTSGYGVQLKTSATLSTSGTMSIAGTSGSGTGVYLQGSNTITDNNGALSISGTSSSYRGVEFSNTNTLNQSGAGLLGITGTTAGTNPFDSGLTINHLSSLTTSGSVMLSGSATSTPGVGFDTNTVTASGGSLVISGTSGSGDGTSFYAGNTLAANGGGAMSISGTSSSGAGILLSTFGSSSISSSGTMTLSGQSASGTGFLMQGSNAITASSGALTITGATSAGPSGIDTSANGNTITNNGSSLLSLNGTGGDKMAATISSLAGDLVLSDTGAVTQSGGTITAGSLMLSGAGSFSLGQANMVGTLAANAGSVSFVNNQNLTIGTVQATAGITTTGTATISVSGNLSLASGAPVSAANPVLAAANAFINNAGAGAVTATSGRWVVYSNTPSGDTFGGLNSGKTAVWNATYGTLPPGSIIAAGNRYLFAYQPTLTLTSTSATKTYGTDVTSAIASNYSVSGYQGGVSNAFLGDNASSTFTGSPSVTSTGTTATASVAGGPYAITAAMGSLASVSGYAFAFSNPGTLTVNPAPITLTVLGGSSIYGFSPANPGLSATGLKNGESAGVLTGLSNSFGITSTSRIGNYVTTVVGTLTNSNYTLVGSNSGTWSVTPLRGSISPSNPNLLVAPPSGGGGNSVLNGLAALSQKVKSNAPAGGTATAAAPDGMDAAASGGKSSAARPGSRNSLVNPGQPVAAPGSSSPAASPPPSNLPAAPPTPAPVSAVPAGSVDASQALRGGCDGGVGGSGTTAAGSGGCAAQASPKEAPDVLDFALSRLNRDALAQAIGQQIFEMARSESTPRNVLMISLASTGFALTVGFVGWLLRGGALVSAFLSSIPLWRGFDPLVILQQPNRNDRPRTISRLDTMFDGAGAINDSAGRPRA